MVVISLKTTAIRPWEFFGFLHFLWPVTLENRSRSLKLGQGTLVNLGYLVVQYGDRTPKKGGNNNNNNNNNDENNSLHL